MKVLEKLKSFIKEEWKFLIFLILMYFALTYELPFAIYTPGGAINMSERIEGENIYNEEGSLSMTYVSMVRGSIPFLALAKVLPNWDIVKTEDITYENEDLDDTVAIDKIYMQEAISNAEVVAYKAAGIEYSEIATHNTVTFVSKEAKTVLKYGDEILRIDGGEYKNLSEFQKYISAKNPGDFVKIEYMRDGKTNIDDVELIELDGVTKAGLSIATISDYKTDFDIEVKTKASESGPSGGLMTALAIYNRIYSTDITKGRKIMGTGTIDREGNVGAIGGVKYKILGAEKEGADMFLCPLENYEEALETKNKNNLKINVVGVATFEEALKALE